MSDVQRMWAINDSIWEIDGMEPWPYLLKSVTLTFDGINPFPTNIPTDFAKVKWLTNMLTTTSSGSQIIWPERIETVRARVGQDITMKGDPALFYFLGNQLRFWPIPPVTANILLDYRAIQPILTTASVETDILMPARYHTAWVWGALVKLYQGDDDPELGAVKKAAFDEKIAKMRMDLMKQQEMRADRIYNLDPDEIAFDPYWIP